MSESLTGYEAARDTVQGAMFDHIEGILRINARFSAPLRLLTRV